MCLRAEGRGKEKEKKSSAFLLMLLLLPFVFLFLALFGGSCSRVMSGALLFGPCQLEIGNIKEQVRNEEKRMMVLVQERRRKDGK